jgi:hypothetical protein
MILVTADEILVPMSQSVLNEASGVTYDGATMNMQLRIAATRWEEKKR